MSVFPGKVSWPICVLMLALAGCTAPPSSSSGYESQPSSPPFYSPRNDLFEVEMNQNDAMMKPVYKSMARENGITEEQARQVMHKVQRAAYGPKE